MQAIPGMVYSAETKTWRLAGGCAAVDSLPSVSFIMSGTSFSLGPRQYIIQVRSILHHTAPATEPVSARTVRTLVIKTLLMHELSAGSPAGCMLHIGIMSGILIRLTV